MVIQKPINSDSSDNSDINYAKLNNAEMHRMELFFDEWTPKTKVSLTFREMQVLKLSLKGYRVKEIAASLGLAERTITVYRDKFSIKLRPSNGIERKFAEIAFPLWMQFAEDYKNATINQTLE